MTKKKRFILGALAVPLLFLLILVFWHYQLRRELKEYQAALIGRGEFLSVTQAWPKPLHGSRESAAAFLTAANRLQGGPVLSQNQVPSMRMVKPGRAAAGSLRPHVRSLYNSQTNSWEDLAKELSANHDAMQAIQATLDGPGLDFDCTDLDSPKPHLAKAKQAAQTFWMATALALHRKELPAAHTNLLTLLSLSQALQNDRLIISHLVQIAIGSIGASATWESLQTEGWNDEQLKSIQQKWQSLRFAEPMQDGLVMERALSSDYVEKMRHSPDTFAAVLDPSLAMAAATGPGPTGNNALDLLGGAFGQLRNATVYIPWKYLWSYEDQLRSLKISQIQIESLRRTNLSLTGIQSSIQQGLDHIDVVAPVENAADDESLLPKIFAAKTMLSDMALNFNQKFINRAFTVETVRELVSTALALKRYHLRYSKYPATLSQLVPEFLPNLPLDRMDGQPLRYRLNPDNTFTLYSVGSNGTDEDGKVTADVVRPRYWTQEPDWVWPALASPEEIAAYEQKQAERHLRSSGKATSTLSSTYPSNTTNSP